MTEKLRVLIGGGTGFVGRHLHAMLQDHGYKVTNISRVSQKGAVTWDEISTNGLPEDCHAVVNLAGERIGNPKKRFDSVFREQIYGSRVDTTATLVKAIREAKVKPKVFVSTSAVGYYKPSKTAEYTEESKGGNFDFLSGLCQDWEDAAKLEPELGVRHVTVRLGIVLGRDGGVIQNMYLPFWFGLGGRIGSGEQWFPWIHAGDAAGIYTHAIEKEDVTGILNGTSPNPVTNNQFTKSFGSAMWRPTIFPVPAFVVNFVFGPERAVLMLEGQKVMPKRTLESGYEFTFPHIDEACRECSSFVPDLARLRQD